MKDAYYFPHDSNARGDPKTKYLISVYGMKGYGTYWVLVEILRDQDGFKLPYDDISLSGLSEDFRLSFDETKLFVDECINRFKLLKTDGQYIWSESLIKRMQKMLTSREKRSAAGKKGMESRWGNKSGKDNNDITMLSEAANNDTSKNNKGKYSKVKESIVEESIIMLPNEAQYISELIKIENYPLDRERDIAYYHELEKRYPEVDLIEMIKDWAVYKIDNPLQENDNPRSQINTQCKLNIKWGKNLKPKNRDKPKGQVILE